MKRWGWVAAAIAGVLLLVGGLVFQRVNRGVEALAVGDCRVLPGPLVLVGGARRNSPAPEYDGVIGDVVDYEVDHHDRAGFVSLVPVDGQATGVSALVNLNLGKPAAVSRARVRQSFLGQRAGHPEADVLAALSTAAVEAGAPAETATVVLQDSGLSSTGTRVGSGEVPTRMPDLSGLTVILDGIGDVAAPESPVPDREAFRQHWVSLVRASGAACVTLTGTRRTDPAPDDEDLPAVSVVG